MDSLYQATYDAVMNSRIDFQVERLANIIADELTAPHVLLRPKIFLDGDSWCCLYGENIQEGVCGFGKTPREACANFDSVYDGGE